VYGDFDVIVYKLVSSYHGMCFTWVVFALPTLFDV
jgi:hypothetical protein